MISHLTAVLVAAVMLFAVVRRIETTDHLKQKDKNNARR